MAQEQLKYSNDSINISNARTLPFLKPQLKPATKSTSHLDTANRSSHSHTQSESLQLRLSTDKESESDERPKRVIYKFKSGETFVSFPFLCPQRIIGEGSYACVCSAIDTRTNKKYAIKKNRNAFVNIGDAKRILREIKLLYHFRGHPNLMTVCDVIPPDPGTQQSFSDVYLVMPKMHMSLSKLISKSGSAKIKVAECDIKTIFYQMCRGIQYMHSGGVIHRDIKPQNVLLNCYFHNCTDPNCNITNKNLWQVRITDFGLARGVNVSNPGNCEAMVGQSENFEVSKGNGSGNGKLTEYVVTRYYRAPEVMCCSRLYDSQIDVWSLGCILGEFFHKKALFRGNNHLHQLQVIFYYCGTPKDLRWVKMSDAKQWISQLPRHKKKDFRKEFKGNGECALMSDVCIDLLQKLLICDPNERWNISQCLKHKFFENVFNANDYKKCHTFDTRFEKEPILRTNFGVRHLMYEELRRIHCHCKGKLMQYKK